MRKIPTLFVRDRAAHLVTRDVTPECQWVLAGEGTPTRKYDGSCAMIRSGRLFKRYDVRGVWLESAPPQFRPNTPIPADFEPCGEPDYPTGHWPGWVPVGDGPEDRWFREVVNADCIVVEQDGDGPAYAVLQDAPDGTYELCGPKVQRNPEKFLHHVLVRHGIDTLSDVPLSFDDLRAYLDGRDIEGIVWHHPDGRMCKLKGRDFGFKRGR